jgi:transposase-like protein
MPAPRFCPNPRCSAHHRAPRGRWYMKNGTYSSQLIGTIQRYKCRLCVRGFSDQTFSIDYYAKRRLSYPFLVALICSCCSIRAAGRTTRLDQKTISNKIMRFARQALAVQLRLTDLIDLNEDLVCDGIQNFWVSQFFPTNLHLLAGADSQFLYGFNGVTIRRSGTMTEAQKRTREKLEKLYKADPKGVETSFFSLMDLGTRLFSRSTCKSLTLRTDEHQAYLRALASHGLYRLLEKNGTVKHRRYSSTLPRTAGNPLFAVNYLDRQLRKDLAENVRETTRFSRGANQTMERLAVFAFNHNFLKRYRIRAPRNDSRTHASVAGIDASVVRKTCARIYSAREFLSRVPFTRDPALIWLRMYQTPLRDTPSYLPAYLTA